MKSITDLPPELLLNICRFLLIYIQRQCLAVSQWWNASVRLLIPTDANKLDLHGYGAIRNLFTEIQANPDSARHIRRLNFIMQTGTGRPVTRDELVAILEGCPNLAEIDFVDVNPFYYLMYMVEEDVQLPKLEFVRVGDARHLASLGHRFVNFAFHYRRTINRLKIRIDSPRFSLNVGVGTICAYFHQFPCLKHLHLLTDCSIVLDELLTACPSLQKLTLDANTARFRAMGVSVGPLAESTTETIELEQSLMTAELYVYLRDHCRHLGQLSVLGGVKNNARAAMSVFGRFARDQALSIVSIAFKGGLDISRRMLERLHSCFPHVRQVEFKECGFRAVMGSNSNIALRFGDLHLDYLSLDLAPIIDHRGSVNKVALEVTLGDTTTWYQRNGKAKARTEFQLKDKKRYTNEVAKQNRLDSNKTAVFIIQAAHVNHIQVHVSTNRASTLNQLIHVENDEDDDDEQDNSE